MPLDDRDGVVGVPVTQRLQDLAVLGEGGGGAVGVRMEHGDAHPQLPVAQLVVEAGEDLVPGAADDLRVEAAVADGGPGQITGRHLRGLLGQQLGQPLDELGSGGHGLARGELLDQQPGLHHVVDLLRGDGEDQGALLRVELDEPLDLQLEQRLAHGRTGDPHGVGELALSEERPALVATVEYGLLDVRVDAVGGGGLSQRGDWHAHSIDTTGIRWGEVSAWRDTDGRRMGRQMGDIQGIRPCPGHPSPSLDFCRLRRPGRQDRLVRRDPLDARRPAVRTDPDRARTACGARSARVEQGLDPSR